MPERALSSLSDALKASTKQAAIAGYRAAVERWGGGEQEVFPGRPLVLGGDDITLILRSDLAWTFVRAYLTAFEEETQSRPEVGGRLTACAGIAFVGSAFPFDRAHDLAEQLTAYAKEEQRRSQSGPIASATAFHRVTASDVDRYGDVVSEELTSVDGRCCLTAGPYMLRALEPRPSMAALSRLVNALGAEKVPTGRVRRVISLLKQDPAAAVDEWKRFAAVQAEKPGNKKAWQKLDSAVEATGHGMAALAGDAPRVRNVLHDAWTLFVEGQGGEGQHDE